MSENRKVDGKKYILEPDMAIRNAGYEFKSKLDLEKEKVDKELKKYSYKSSTTTLLFTFFPIAGLHRLTNGKILSGLLFAVTGGGLLLWMIFDMLLIAAGKFTDAEGRYINSSKRSELQMKKESLTENYYMYRSIYKQQQELTEMLEQNEWYDVCEEIANE